LRRRRSGEQTFTLLVDDLPPLGDGVVAGGVGAAAAAGGVLAVGVAHGSRIVDELPRAAHDARLDLLLSENGLEAAGA